MNADTTARTAPPSSSFDRTQHTADTRALAQEPPGACSGPLPPEGEHSPARPSSSASASAHQSAKRSVFDIVTDQLIAALERGTVPWRKSWDAGGFQLPRNLVSGKPYQGINFFILSVAGERFASPYWLTFRQARERGGSVRKGETGTPVFFWRVYDRQAGEGEGGPDREGQEKRFVARYYTVFNVEQCDGIEYPRPKRTVRTIGQLETCEHTIAPYARPPSVRHGGTVASYSPIGDVVNMPERSVFHTAEGYYSVLFHELVHSTGHPKRLARFEPGEPPPPFGSPDYSREELVAEMGAAFLCARAGIGNQTLEDSASYIAGWLRVLEADKRAVVFAAAAARKAAELIAGTAE
jgi:antirestriction protein ArdC